MLVRAFFVLPTDLVEAKLGDRKGIGLSKLWELGVKEVGFDGIAEAVREAVPPAPARRFVS